MAIVGENGNYHEVITDRFGNALNEVKAEFLLHETQELKYTVYSDELGRIEVENIDNGL